MLGAISSLLGVSRMDNTTKRLFGRFPREVYLWRKMVNSLEELQRELKNGAKHIAIYDKDFIIDKVVLDIDSKSVEESLRDAGEIINRAKNEGVSYIPVFSGRRGFHLYLLFNSIQSPNIETGRYIVETAQRYFSVGVKNVDSQIIGDIRHLIRIPNTHHEKSNCYCTYLPLDFIDWEPSEIVDWAKEPHDIHYALGKNEVELRNFINIIGRVERETFDLKKPDLPQHKIPRDVRGMLEGLIRPCLINEIFNDPNHKIRTELAVELKLLGYGASSIVEIISRLGWKNFDRKTTEYQIRRICEGDLKPMTNKTLRRERLNPTWRRYPCRKERAEVGS